VIRHQAIGIKVEREPRLLVGELQEEFTAVVIRSEDELAIVASSDDVVEPSLDFESRLAHCASSLLLAVAKCKVRIAFCTPDPQSPVPESIIALPCSRCVQRGSESFAKCSGSSLRQLSSYSVRLTGRARSLLHPRSQSGSLRRIGKRASRRWLRSLLRHTDSCSCSGRQLRSLFG